MDCPKCGAVNVDGAAACASCGQSLAAAEPEARVTAIIQPPRWQTVPPGDPTPPPLPGAWPAYPPPLPTRMGDDPGMRMLLPVGRSWLAILAGYVGLFAILVIPAPFALLLGILAIRHIRRNPGKHGMGRAVFAVVMGGLFTLLPLIGLAIGFLVTKFHR